MTQSQLFTNHLLTLAALYEQPDLRLRDLAEQTGITERSAHRIVGELVRDGYLVRRRVGARNHYEIGALPSAAEGDHAPQAIERVLRTLIKGRTSPPDADTPSIAARLGAAFAAAPAGICVTGPDGRLRAANPAFSKLLDRPEHDLVGRDFRDFTHPDDTGRDSRAFEDLISGKQTAYLVEKRYLRADGTSSWAKISASGFTDPETGERLIVTNIMDINERKREQQALAEAEERFRSAFDHAPIGMALITPDGRWIKVNRALCELTGYSETMLLTRSPSSITHPEDLQSGLAQAEQMLAGTRRTCRLRKRYVHASGRALHAIVSVSLVRSSSGEPLYFITQIEAPAEQSGA